MDLVYSKNELAEILEKKRKTYLSYIDHNNGTGGCSCNIKLINNKNINNKNINNKNINNKNNYITNKYVNCCIGEY
jgi:hypothetical protein